MTHSYYNLDDLVIWSFDNELGIVTELKERSYFKVFWLIEKIYILYSYNNNKSNMSETMMKKLS